MGAVVREQVLRIMANGFARAGCWYRMPNCRFVTRLWALSNLNVFVWRAVMMRNPKMRKWISLYKTPRIKRTPARSIGHTIGASLPA
jgi:hypothetical protein